MQTRRIRHGSCRIVLLVRKHPRLPLTRVDFPVSGENVRKADKRGMGSIELSAELTEGEIFNGQIDLFAYTAEVPVNVQITESQNCQIHGFQFFRAE